MNPLPFVVRFRRADGTRASVRFARYAVAWAFYFRMLTIDPRAEMRT
jgi:hypothetical protein